MSLFYALLLGIVQGLTEFIPVSSTAHLLLAQHLLRIAPDDPGIFAFNVLVQWGTLAAVIVYYWTDLWAIARSWVDGLRRRKPFEDPESRLGWYLILATLPVLVAGYIFKPVVAWLFQAPVLEAVIRLSLTALLLFLVERFGKRTRGMETFTWKDALWVGLAQVFAILPGASRSGSTLFGGMARSLDRPTAARFAFLLSAPVLFAAGVYELFGLRYIPNLWAFIPNLLVGALTAAVVGYFAIRWLLAFLARRSLYAFVIYCAALSVVMLFALWLPF